MSKRNELFKTSIGGQALIEGVMMRGPEKTAMAVRVKDGSIVVEEGPSEKVKLAKVPLVRGVMSMITSLKIGYKYMMRSSELAMEDIEDDKLSLYLKEKFGDKVENAISTVIYIIAVFLALGLFVVIPTFITGLIGKLVTLGRMRAVIEGILKMTMFLMYLYLISRLEDIRRVFQYHGAEHKTISCYEAGDEITVENIKKHTRFHPRCGTSFLFIVIAVSILVSSLITTESTLARVGLKLLLLPVVMGISYEIIKYSGSHDNWLSRALAAPGLWVQRLTTREPDDDQIEVAMTSFLRVLPEDGSDRC
ncbi:MAG: DUF1385 domain-containing protein [Oscillospiraceae bacterium]|nr:DUF1385 domain-containing protein [Oscillospiraceae bacterium]